MLLWKEPKRERCCPARDSVSLFSSAHLLKAKFSFQYLPPMVMRLSMFAELIRFEDSSNGFQNADRKACRIREIKLDIAGEVFNKFVSPFGICVDNIANIPIKYNKLTIGSEHSPMPRGAYLIFYVRANLKIIIII